MKQFIDDTWLVFLGIICGGFIGGAAMGSIRDGIEVSLSAAIIFIWGYASKTCKP